jgi:hypothetical protein
MKVLWLLPIKILTRTVVVPLHDPYSTPLKILPSRHYLKFSSHSMGDSRGFAFTRRHYLPTPLEDKLTLISVASLFESALVAQGTGTFPHLLNERVLGVPEYHHDAHVAWFCCKSSTEDLVSPFDCC